MNIETENIEFKSQFTEDIYKEGLSPISPFFTALDRSNIVALTSSSDTI